MAIGRALVVVAALAFLPTLHAAQAQPVVAPSPDTYLGKARIFVLTDIGNEPDDQMSFVRLLLYSNEIDIQGLAAVTSTWLRSTTNPQTLHEIVSAYGRVRPNLLLHAKGWPHAERLAAMVSTGPRGFGMDAIDPDRPSTAALALIRAADSPDRRPLWISIWGGANVLAEALKQVRRNRTPEQVASFLAKLRVYSISDQDDAGPWIRRQFPRLQYVVSPSLPDSDDYPAATWSGISGDVLYANGDGADGTTITNEWLEAHIRKGPLGAHYPRFEYIMEGDTPSFLGFTQNGLNSALSPAWGGWGGRYVYRSRLGEAGPIWTQGGTITFGANSRDAVTGADGQTRISDQATVWRWRNVFQNDFAARINWTIKPPFQANHHPIAMVNNVSGTGPIFIEVEAGKPIVVDAGASRDPDRGQQLSFRWFHYREAGASLGPLADVEIESAGGPHAIVTAPAPCRAITKQDVPACPFGIAHVILEVSDNGSPRLTSYRRVIMTIRNPAGR